MLDLIAQVQIQDRSSGDASCVADNGFCPSWIVDNFDRYTDPLLQHVFLTLVSRRDRVRASRSGSRCSPTASAGSSAPITQITGDPLHAAEPRRLLPAAAAHRAREHHGDHRARRLLAPDHLPQHHHRARQRARGDEGRRPRHGAHRPAAPLARRAAARAARDPRGAADRGDHHGRPRHARLLRRRRRPRRADLRRPRLQVERGDRGRARGAAGRRRSTCSSCWCSGRVTPWTRARAA